MKYCVYVCPVSLAELCIAEREPFSYPEPFLRAVRRGALAKSITGYHKNMVRKQCPVLELANQMPVNASSEYGLARAPRRTARKKGSGYENERELDFVHVRMFVCLFVVCLYG